MMADDTASQSKGIKAFSRERFQQEVAQELGIDLAGPLGRRARAVPAPKGDRAQEPSRDQGELPPEG